jgi:hypothetical protein
VGNVGFAIDILLLLTLDEERGAFRGGARLAYGLSAALLSDLASLGRVRVTSRAVTVENRARTGHTLLDVHLAQLAGDHERTPQEWIGRWARPALIEHIAERLRVATILETREDRTLGVIPVRRHRVIPPRLLIDLRAHLHGVIDSESHAVSAELASVAAILSVLKDKGVLPSGGRGVASARARDLARDDEISVALGRALYERARQDDVSAAVVVMNS